MKIATKLLLLIGGLCFAGHCFGDTVTLTGVGGAYQGNPAVYVAPYYLTVDGTPNVPVMCVDYSHDVVIGESWKVNISQLAAGDLGNTRLGNAGLTQYTEAAWLYSQIAGNSSEAGDINFAAWAIISGLSTMEQQNGAGVTADAISWYNKALGHSNFNTAGFEIISPTDLTGTSSILYPTGKGLGSPQEYILSTPEPTSILLVGSGIAAAMLRRRKRPA